MKISIAMATYNGEKYVQEQLESLAAQKYQPHELVVCDDGSADETLSIVESFAVTAPFPVRIYRNEENLGYSDNFLKAAKLCEGDWVAFCDQDDVWFPNKLEEAASAIGLYPNLTMVLQNAELCDGQLKRRGPVFPNKIKPGVHGANSQYGFWVWLGFLQTVRSDLLTRIDATKRPPNYFPGHKWQSHDKWTCMIANALGGICVLGEPVARYRRHEGALTGSYTSKSIVEQLNESRAVDGKHYRFLAEVAKSSRIYLDRAAGEVGDDQWRHLLSRSAECFGRLADIQSHRAALYEAESILGRAAHYLRILCSGGYVMRRFTSMGAKSALKDAARFFLGSSIMTRKAE